MKRNNGGNLKSQKAIKTRYKAFVTSKDGTTGITLIALVITIALNRCRGGRI